MKPFCFLHAADLHLDTPFAGIAEVAPALQQRLRDASLSAFDNLIRTAIERRVEFVVLAGDIYDGAERGTRAQVRFLNGLRELDKHGIQSFFIHGNHDPVGEGWSALRREDFPGSVVLFDQSDQVVSTPVQRNGEIIAVVHGISFRTRHETRNLSRLFPDQRAGGPWHVGLLHCNVGGVGEHGNYAPCTTEDLCSRGMDYWALGHIHKRQVVREAAPCIHYPGNLQARGFDECGAKGATLVRVHGPSQVELEFVAADEIRFSRIEADVAGCESLDQVFGKCEEAIATELSGNDGRFVLIRLQIAGQASVHATLQQAAASDDDGLLTALRDRLPADRVWLDSVRLGTLPIVDRDQLASATGFESALVKQSNEWLASEEKLAEFLKRVQQPLRTGNRFREFLDELPACDKRRLLEAEGRLLSLLQAEDQP